MGDMHFDDLFEDLEQQAAGLGLAERDAELADRARGEYAAVTLASRVHASGGCHVRLRLVDRTLVEGSLTQAGPDWCGVSRVAATGATESCVVRLAAVSVAEGLSARSVAEAARPVTARLGFGSALHRIAGDGRMLRLRLLGVDDLEGRLRRVGADFAELEPVGRHGEPVVADPVTTLVPFAAVLAAWG